MRKVIASINMSLDGFCDHDKMSPDDALHRYFNDLLRNSETMLFGRITYKLMEEAWPAIAKNPTGNGPMDEFALLIDRIQKIVFSSTLPSVEWNNTTLLKGGVEETVLRLKGQTGGPILAASRSVILALLRRGLVDEFQLCVHPTLVGSGLPLFTALEDRIELRLLKTRSLGSGIVVLYYEPRRG